jgi:hypothetical protein
MRTSENNPISNKLPQGIKVDELTEAIELSGYPLQAIVASKLKDKYSVTEEWGYIYSDTKEHRCLDLFAYHSFTEDGLGSVKPSVVLLIECKRSRHPYIFFQEVDNRHIDNFPTIAGLTHGTVELQDRTNKNFREFPVATVLDLDTHPFVNPGPSRCATFSKAIPNKNRIALYGEEPFNKIVLPLSKAHDHAYQYYKLPGKQSILFPTMLICLCVMDASMILVEGPEKPDDPLLVPWVRIVRHEAVEDSRNQRAYKFYSIDVVHVDYFDEFQNENLLPFANEFKQHAIEAEGILFIGGEVENLNSWDWRQIRTRAK